MKPLQAPCRFGVRPFAGRWFSWHEVNRCFWPRSCGSWTSNEAHPELAPVIDLGGIYMLAWSGRRLAEPTAIENGIRYIGETNWFKARLRQFGASAGFFGKRRNGHSAGWRWPEGQTKNMRVAFFPVPPPREQPHLGVGLRKWLEALAIEDYRETHGRIPRVNELVRDKRGAE